MEQKESKIIEGIGYKGNISTKIRMKPYAELIDLQNRFLQSTKKKYSISELVQVLLDDFKQHNPSFF